MSGSVGRRAGVQAGCGSAVRPVDPVRGPLRRRRGAAECDPSRCRLGFRGPEATTEAGHGRCRPRERRGPGGGRRNEAGDRRRTGRHLAALRPRSSGRAGPAPTAAARPPHHAGGRDDGRAHRRPPDRALAARRARRAGRGGSGAAPAGLLGADAVGLVDLDGARTWAGPAPDGADGSSPRSCARTADALADDAHALPLHVRDEPVGVLVVVGPVPDAAARQAAAWVADALHRGRLEASADAAEQAELRALRAEISPHFVYNALTTIASFVRSDPDRARELHPRLRPLHPAQPGPPRRVHDAGRRVPRRRGLPHARPGRAGRAAARAGAHRARGAAGGDPLPRAAAAGGERRPARRRARGGRRVGAGQRRVRRARTA